MNLAPLRIFIVDDEVPARLRMRALLEDIAAELPHQVVGEADNGARALEMLTAPGMAADVLLADIRMPGMDGMELAARVRGLPRPPALVFTTACENFALQAFELNAADYLLKPIRAQRLLAALEKARHSLQGQAELLELAEGRRHLPVNERGRILLLPVADILYLRAELKYLTARTREREFLLDESLAHLEQEYPRRFLRIHRNCLVARHAITGFERDADEGGDPRWRVVLNGLEDTLPVSRRQWPAVKAEMESS